MFITDKNKFFFQGLIIFIIVFFGYRNFEKIVYLHYPGRLLESKEYLLKNEKYSIIIMGNSHTSYSINPEIINNVMKNGSSLNLSSNGAGIPTIYFYLKKAIDLGQKPDILLIEAYTFRYNDFDESLPMINNKIYQKSIFDILTLIPIKDHNRSFSFFSENYRWKNLFSTIETNIEYRKEIKNIEEYEKNEFKGYIQVEEIVSRESFDNTYQRDAFPIDFEYYEKLILEIMHICEQNDIELLFFRAPTINTLGIHDEYMQHFAHTNVIEFLDLNDNILNEIDNPRLLFSDSFTNNAGMVNSHTNYNGAVYTSLKLAEELQDLGYLEIDQEIYDQYWSELQDDLNSIEVK